MKNLFFSLMQCAFILTLTFMISCGSSADIINQTDCNETLINSASEEFVAKATAYVQNPTQENCEAYKVATEAYLEAIDDCDGLYEMEVESAKDAIAELDCQ